MDSQTRLSFDQIIETLCEQFCLKHPGLNFRHIIHSEGRMHDVELRGFGWKIWLCFDVNETAFAQCFSVRQTVVNRLEAGLAILRDISEGPR